MFIPHIISHTLHPIVTCQMFANVAQKKTKISSIVMICNVCD